MKIYVINLKRSSERRRNMAAQLDQLGLVYEFFDAIDGKGLSAQDLVSVYNQAWARRHVGRDLLPGEIGCALSHLGVYKQMIRDHCTCALVLEDDALISQNAASVLNVMENIFTSEQPLICLLSECAGVNFQQSVNLAASCAMAPITSAAYLAHAYVITLESARRLADTLFPVVQVADDWGWISRHTGVVLHACLPPLATTAQASKPESTIAGPEICRGECLDERFVRWRWWKNKLYRKFWHAVDCLGLGYRHWR